MIGMAISYGESFFEPIGLPQRCSACRQRDDLRREWGCEEKSANAQLWIPCLHCHGESHECSNCHGSGREAIHRCPNAIVEQWAIDAVLMYRYWPDALPFSGGMLEQPHRYVRAMMLCDFAKVELETVKRKREEKGPGNGDA